MNCVALCCCASLLMLLLQAGQGLAHPVTWGPSSQELQSLQDLLERLKEKFQQGQEETLDLEVPNYGAGEAADGSFFDLADPEALPATQLRSQPPLPQGEVVDQWRKFLASPKRRRHFSGCFGTRLERIGTQTGLGCNIYRARSWKKPRS